MLNILFIGDIIGQYGRKVVKYFLPSLKEELHLDLVIANAENSAHGYGITEKVYKELLETGIDLFTSGNHIWDKKEFAKIVEKFPLLVRPANYPDGVPGLPALIIEKNGLKIAVTNLLGRTFMPPMDCPFQSIDKLLPSLKKETKIIIVDIHAEATSEKWALGHYLDGRVSAVLGTHTHVMTADERISPSGAAFITDVGMAGSYDSIIGMNREQILKRFITGMPEKFEPCQTGVGLFNAVLLKIDPVSGKTLEIIRISKTVDFPK